jgi:thioredoxin reductase
MFVANGAKTVLAGLGNMKTAMIDDYAKFMPPKDEITKKMNEDYAENFTITYGKKYIKFAEKDGGVKGFVVNTDNDKKFKKGDILMAAGYSKPARNAARGNILDGGYAIKWTGPLYLK